VIYNTFLLGDVGKAFNLAENSHLARPIGDIDNQTRYESLYLVDKPIKF
jgi:hypothetical protein